MKTECTCEYDPRAMGLCPLHEAAPDMLEALESARDAICLIHCQAAASKEMQGKHVKVCNQASKVIAKARGEL